MIIVPIQHNSFVAPPILPLAQHLYQPLYIKPTHQNETMETMLERETTVERASKLGGESHSPVLAD